MYSVVFKMLRHNFRFGRMCPGKDCVFLRRLLAAI